MASVVLVEPYYGGSHQAWADSWVRHSAHDISLITHPDEFWRWRLRGGAVTLAESFASHVGDHGAPDVVVVSGLVDVAGFVGQARRSLGGVPVATYVHESQLLYPLAPNQRTDSSAALINWQSLVASDAVWFNSAFHRDGLHNALPRLLDAQPAPTHSHLIADVFARASVLWPGVETNSLANHTRSSRSVPLVVWNQRWDHDKNPHAVFSALANLADDGVPFRLALAGQNQQRGSRKLGAVLDRLRDRIDHQGFVPNKAYTDLLLQSDVVVSAADHEFFGIAIVEAIAAGALPVLPQRLSFPELIEPRWHELALYPDGELRSRLRHVLVNHAEVRGELAGLRDSMRQFDASLSAAAHDDAVNRLI